MIASTVVVLALKRNPQYNLTTTPWLKTQEESEELLLEELLLDEEELRELTLDVFADAGAAAAPEELAAATLAAGGAVAAPEALATTSGAPVTLYASAPLPSSR